MNVDCIREMTVPGPRKLLRMCLCKLGLTKSTVQKMIKHDFKLYPYKLKIIFICLFCSIQNNKQNFMDTHNYN